MLMKMEYALATSASTSRLHLIYLEPSRGLQITFKPTQGNTQYEALFVANALSIKVKE